MTALATRSSASLHNTRREYINRLVALSDQLPFPVSEQKRKECCRSIETKLREIEDILIERGETIDPQTQKEI